MTENVTYCDKHVSSRKCLFFSDPALHGVLFIQPSTGSCSSTPNRLDRGLVHPAATASTTTGSCSTTPPCDTVHPALHQLLFNQPSTGSCSSSSPWGPVHPPPTGSIGVLFIQRQRPLLPRGPVHPPPPGTIHPTPQQRSLFIKRQQVRSASVSSSSKGIARSGSVNSHRSIARVQ